MKTVQDWGFISKEQGLVKPKLQDNKIFHALTTAYENTHQNEIYGATENIVRREKELCELALGDLKKMSEGKGESDGTLKLIMDHYQSRLVLAKEKEEKINHLSEDSRKMMEEYKKRTQELAEVKRNLMESQTKLRELAKTTERLLKKEEELRFIETNLRTELDKNKRNIINGLYEIVSDLSDQAPAGLESIAPAIAQTVPESGTVDFPPALVPAQQIRTAPKPVLSPVFAPAAREEVNNPFQSPAQAQEQFGAPRHFTEGLFRKPEPPTPKVEAPSLVENVWTRDKPVNPSPNAFSIPVGVVTQNLPFAREGGLIEKAARLKMFEPGRSLVSKSMVKTAEGEIISEYFYSPVHPREGRHYIFNSLFAVWSLLSLKAKDHEAFQDRLETVMADLLSRLEHSRNIHLEGFLSQEMNPEIIGKILATRREDRPALFETIATKLVNRIESVGPGRAGLIDHQFKQLPKPEFPPKPGLSA